MGQLDRDAQETARKVAEGSGCAVWLFPGLLILGVAGSVLSWLAGKVEHVPVRSWLALAGIAVVIGAVGVVLAYLQRKYPDARVRRER